MKKADVEHAHLVTGRRVRSYFAPTVASDGDMM